MIKKNDLDFARGLFKHVGIATEKIDIQLFRRWREVVGISSSGNLEILEIQRHRHLLKSNIQQIIGYI